MMLSYNDKVIVAPMVRVSTLPFRLACIDYGADIVFTEEIIDFKILRSLKQENEFLGTTDFIDKTDGTVFFRTCDREKPSLVFQIGTSDSKRALAVAKLVEQYVSAIDVNMGCPKEFSIKGGMGAALLKQPEKVENILSTLVTNLSIPVTCKIRVLPSLEETIRLCKRIEACGVCAITVHGRTKDERPNDPNKNHFIKEISNALRIPVIANGGSKEINSLSQVSEFREKCGSSSVMLARAVMWNCSMLRKEGKLPLDDVIRRFLHYCIKYENPFTFTKYTVQNMLRDQQQNTSRGKAFLEAQTLQEICGFWGLNEEFNQHLSRSMELKTPHKFNYKSCVPQSLDDVKVMHKVCPNGIKITEIPLQFIRGNYSMALLPKMVLNTYFHKKFNEHPKYETKVDDKFFTSRVKVGEEIYGSPVREKSRRYAEQGAALVCLHILGIVEKTYGFTPAAGTRKHSSFENSKSEDGLPNKKIIKLNDPISEPS